MVNTIQPKCFFTINTNIQTSTSSSRKFITPRTSEDFVVLNIIIVILLIARSINSNIRIALSRSIRFEIFCFCDVLNSVAFLRFSKIDCNQLRNKILNKLNLVIISIIIGRNSGNFFLFLYTCYSVYLKYKKRVLIVFVLK